MKPSSQSEAFAKTVYANSTSSNNNSNSSNNSSKNKNKSNSNNSNSNNLLQDYSSKVLGMAFAGIATKSLSLHLATTYAACVRLLRQRVQTRDLQRRNTI